MALPQSPKKIAIVYDRVNTRHGGAELVLLAIHQVFPSADLITSVADLDQANWAKVFPKVKTSWLQNFPAAKQAHRWLAQFMPIAFETLNLAEYDLIISVTSAEAKGVLTTPNQLHVCYLLAPPRYLYHQRLELLTANKFTSLPIIGWFAKQALNYLEWWDQVAIHRPDVILPLSERVANQVKTFYSHPPKTLTPVLYPPVSISNSVSLKPIKNQLVPKSFFLQVARLVPYKKAVISLQAAALARQNLVIVGEGPDLKLVKNLAQQLTETTKTQLIILGSVSAENLAWLYANCQAVLMPGEEDFGLTALEANAAGKPVIINRQSGAAETITDLVHGLHLLEAAPKDLAYLMLKTFKIAWDSQLLRQNAAKYGTSMFVTQLTNRLNTYWRTHIQANHNQ